MKSKIVLITRATSGIGRETAYGLAGMGAKVVYLARDARKAALTINEIKERTGNTKTDFKECDLASLESVKKAADVFTIGDRTMQAWYLEKGRSRWTGSNTLSM